MSDRTASPQEALPQPLYPFAKEETVQPGLNQPAAAAQHDNCPKCHHRLGAPLKSSGRRVCGRCGWIDKPRSVSVSNPNPDRSTDLPPDELQQLLAKAASESLTNMKPKRKLDDKGQGIGRFFPPFGNQ